MEALLGELCTRYGWCLPAKCWDSLTNAWPQESEAITASIVQAVFGDDWIEDKHTIGVITALVEDWLFSPDGRGERSRLPHV